MPDPAPLRLALMQDVSPAGDIAHALLRVEQALTAAGAAGAAMLITPETWLPGYNVIHPDELALTPAGDWQTRLADACSKANCGLAIGYAESGAGAIYNSALILGRRGEVLAHYRKLQLYGPREAALYQAGDHYAAFKLDGHNVGVLICYDVEFAPHVAALAAKGITVIVVPTANMQPFTHVMRATVPAMAANHGVAIAYANYCGVERDLIYAGRSLICGPQGEIAAQAGDTPALLIADLPARVPDMLSTQRRDYRAADWPS